MGLDKAVAPLVLESEVTIAGIFWILFNVNFTRDSEPDNYFKREAAKSKGSGLSGANVVCAAERSSSPPDEVDATGKNKFQSLSIILSRRQPIQKALD